MMSDSVFEGATARRTLRGNWEFVIGEGVALAAVTLAGYVIAFAYEMGFSGFFGFPTGLISVSYGQIFMGAGSLLGFLGISLVFAEGVLVLTPDRLKGTDEMVVGLGFCLATVIGFFRIYGLDLEAYTILARVLLATCLIGIVAFVVASLIPTARKSSKPDPWESRGLSDVLTARTPARPILFALVVAVLVAFAHGLGREGAAHKTDFITTGRDDGFVGVAVYGGSVLWVQAEDGKFVHSYRITRVGERPLRWNVERLGPLEPPAKAHQAPVE